MQKLQLEQSGSQITHLIPLLHKFCLQYCLYNIMDIDYKSAYEIVISGKKVHSAQQTRHTLDSLLYSPIRIISTLNEWRAMEKNTLKQDFDLITRFYNRIQTHQPLPKTYGRLLSFYQQLEQVGELKALLQQKKDVGFLIFGLFWKKLFVIEMSYLPLLKCLNLLRAADSYRDTILQWLAGMPANYITTVISTLHDILTSHFDKLTLPVLQPAQILSIKLNIRNITHFLKLVYQSNNQLQRIPQELFKLKSIRQYFDVKDQFRLHLRNIDQLNFISYPFLLQFDYKYQLLQIQSAFEQRSNIQQGLSSLFVQGTIFLERELFIETILFLHFQVNRNNLLNDSMEKLNHVKQNLKNPLRISFIGEEGIDDGGVTKEYFQSITKEIFNPYLDMFVPINKNRFHWFNGFSYQPPIRFQFVGMLLGLALYNNVQLDIRFPLILYHKLLSRKEEPPSLKTIQDLIEIQPQVCASLKNILAMEHSFEDLALDFTVQLINFGDVVVKELTEGGSNIAVTADNKTQYCICMADYLLHKHIEKQFKAFQNGFFRVVTGNIIDIFQPFQLQKIICGSENIDFEELELNAKYQGYTAQSQYIQTFWKILKEAPLEDKKKFLTFVTGTDRIPVGGLGKVKLIVQRHANLQLLPIAHTCFNVLELPQYTSIDQLYKNIKIVMENNQGFGLL